MARKKESPVEAAEPLVAKPVDHTVDQARLVKTQRLYAIAGNPDCAEEFEALRAELAASE